MPREKESYRDILESLLEFSQGRHLLKASEAASFLGLCRQTVVKKYSFKDGYITAETLARELC